MTYEQRRKALIDSILAKLKESGHESDLIEPDKSKSYFQWCHFRRESDGAMVQFRADVFYVSSSYKSIKTALPYIEVAGSRRQKFNPSVERKSGGELVTKKEVDPAKVAAKVIREFDYEAKRMSDAAKGKAEADAIDAKADEINQRVGRNVVCRKSLGSDLIRPGGRYVMRVDLRDMNDGEVESFVDDMQAAGLLKWLKDRGK